MNKQINLAVDLLLSEGLFRTGSSWYSWEVFLFFFIPLFGLSTLAFIIAISFAKLKNNETKHSTPNKNFSNMNKDANKISGAILILAGFHAASEFGWLEITGIITLVIGIFTFISGFTGVRTP